MLSIGQNALLVMALACDVIDWWAARLVLGLGILNYVSCKAGFGDHQSSKNAAASVSGFVSRRLLALVRIGRSIHDRLNK